MLRNIIFSLLIISISCNSPDVKSGASEISKIELQDRTFVDYYVNKKFTREVVVTDLSKIEDIKTQIDLMKKVPEGGTRRSFGYYGIILYLKNGDRKIYDIVYTVYDGVIINEEGTENKYKNNELEHLIDAYFTNIK